MRRLRLQMMAGGVITPLLLDLYPNAAAAYSLRKLRNGYGGSAIRVRRSSDNAEQDIAFVSGNLDTASLASFCFGTDGFVTTFYDQSGNNRNVIQTSAINQPQIVSFGNLILQNGRPVISFTSNNKRLQSASNVSLVFIDATTSYVSRNVAQPADFNGMFGFGNNGQGSLIRYAGSASNTNYGYSTFGSDYVSTISATNDSSLALYSSKYTAFPNLATLYKNATTQSGSPTTGGTISLGKFAINTIADRNSSGTIFFSEGVFYAFNNSQILLIRDNQRLYYSIY